MLIIQNQNLESQITKIAKELKTDTKELLEKIIKEFVVSQELKKADEIAKNVKDGYLEVLEAKKNGKKLPNALDLLHEL